MRCVVYTSDRILFQYYTYSNIRYITFLSPPPFTPQDRLSAMYSLSIEKLRSVLLAMQTSSAKRADLEQRLRGQLELRLQHLQSGRKEETQEGEGEEWQRERIQELETTVVTLEADVVKVHVTHTCNNHFHSQ